MEGLEGMDEFPEEYYFMNESESDVTFIIEGKSLPAMKHFLCVKNTVFRAMFLGKFKESKEKEVDIDGTSFDAFKSLIRFLYSDELVLKDEKDFKLIEEVFELSDRYNSKRLLIKISDHLNSIELTPDNSQTILKIASRFKFEGLVFKVKAFIDNNFESFIVKPLNELNEFTHNFLWEVTANKYQELKNEKTQMANELIHKRDSMRAAMGQWEKTLKELFKAKEEIAQMNRQFESIQQ